jgi:predicted transposase/invertase (TIGR01784 family)
MLRAVRKRGKGAPLKAYAHVLFTAANAEVMKEVKKMATTMEMFEVFRDVFGFDEEWEEKVRGEGREEGWKEGREEERMTMAKNLLAYGVDPVIIAKSSGLTLDKIQKIAL